MSLDLLQNPYLILGVSSDADMASIQSVGKRRLMMLRLDDQADPATARRIEAALDALADPIARFEWGLFSPELTQAEADAFRADPVLSTFGDDPLQDFAAAYERLCVADSPSTRSHNIGCLKLVQAVAATAAAQDGTPDDISDDLACVPLWSEAFKHLRLVLQSEKFWMRQNLRAKSYDDRRLNADRVAEIRSSTASRIVEPVGTVIQAALLSHHVPVAKAYVDLLRSSGFDATFVDDTLSRVYKPLADRIERAVSELSSELGSASNDHAFRPLLARFQKQVLPALEVMIAVGDLPGYAEEHARDAAADFLRSLSIKTFNSTQDIDTSKQAIVLAERIVDSASQRTRYRADLAVLEEQAKSQRLKPQFEQLGTALQSGNLLQAMRLIDEILAAGGDGSFSELRVLRRKISSNYATQLFNEALAEARRGDKAAAQRKLHESRRWETEPSELAIIDNAIAQLALVSGGNRASTGCVLAILQLVAGVVLLGLIGGAMHACSH